jgi:uncharacterized membrane protein
MNFDFLNSKKVAFTLKHVFSQNRHLYECISRSEKILKKSKKSRKVQNCLTKKLIFFCDFYHRSGKKYKGATTPKHVFSQNRHLYECISRSEKILKKSKKSRKVQNCLTKKLIFFFNFFFFGEVGLF